MATTGNRHERPVWSNRPAPSLDAPAPWGSPAVWLLAVLAGVLGCLFAIGFIELTSSPPTLTFESPADNASAAATTADGPSPAR